MRSSQRPELDQKRRRKEKMISNKFNSIKETITFNPVHFPERKMRNKARKLYFKKKNVMD